MDGTGALLTRAVEVAGVGEAVLAEEGGAAGAAECRPDCATGLSVDDWSAEPAASPAVSTAAVAPPAKPTRAKPARTSAVAVKPGTMRVGAPAMTTLPKT